jgi:hypothetical protein
MNQLHIQGLTINFENSPQCAYHDSSGQKSKYGLITFAYQVYYLEVPKRQREKFGQKQPELFANNSWILHHDNASAHMTLSLGDFS